MKSNSTPKDHRLTLLPILVGGLAGLMALNYSSEPAFPRLLSWVQWIPLRCPLKLLTDLDCPLCGLGRSLIAVAGGDLARAWAFHPLGPLAVLMGFTSLILYFWDPGLFQALLNKARGAWARVSPGWKYLALGIYLGTFVARNIPWT